MPLTLSDLARNCLWNEIEVVSMEASEEAHHQMTITFTSNRIVNLAQSGDNETNVKVDSL
jgi:hypothetical protein